MLDWRIQATGVIEAITIREFCGACRASSPPKFFSFDAQFLVLWAPMKSWQDCVMFWWFVTIIWRTPIQQQQRHLDFPFWIFLRSSHRMLYVICMLTLGFHCPIISYPTSWGLYDDVYMSKDWVNSAWKFLTSYPLHRIGQPKLECACSAHGTANN